VFDHVTTHYEVELPAKVQRILVEVRYLEPRIGHQDVRKLNRRFLVNATEIGAYGFDQLVKLYAGAASNIKHALGRRPFDEAFGVRINGKLIVT